MQQIKYVYTWEKMHICDNWCDDEVWKRILNLKGKHWANITINQLQRFTISKFD